MRDKIFEGPIKKRQSGGLPAQPRLGIRYRSTGRALERKSKGKINGNMIKRDKIE